MDYLDNDIKFVGGVGEARARLLDKELGIRTLGDMLRHYPFRYIDRTKVYRIAEITDDAPTLLQFRARVTGVAYAGTGRKRRFTAYVSDPTGSAELVWFQGIKWIEKRVEVGREYLIFGRPSFYRGELSMAHPELETMEQALSRKAESGMQGIYPSTEKLSNVLGAKGMYQIICNAWALAKDHIPDYMPDEVRTRYGLIPLRDAYYNIHFPQSPELLRQAQYRLKFDELLGIQLNVQSRRTERLAKNNGFLFMKVGGRLQHLLQRKATVPAHRSAETGHQGDPAGHRHGLPDEPPVAGRRRQRQDPRGADVDAAGRGQRLPGLHDGAHRDPRPPAFRHHHAYARRHGGEGRHPHRRLEGQGSAGWRSKGSPRARCTS